MHVNFSLLFSITEGDWTIYSWRDPLIISEDRKCIDTCNDIYGKFTKVYILFLIKYHNRQLFLLLLMEVMNKGFHYVIKVKVEDYGDHICRKTKIAWNHVFLNKVVDTGYDFHFFFHQKWCCEHNLWDEIMINENNF